MSRPAHPLRTPKDAVDAVKSGDKWFSTFDAVQGYWQMILAKEARPLTTFMSHQGRYRFLRCPMGLNATGDEYCRRGDLAIQGLKCVEKVVDDLLVHSQSLDEHITHVRDLLQRCRETGITLSKKKFNFAKKEVNFVGYIINENGIAADPTKLDAIAKFPAPKNLTELRSFMGLVNQLGMCIQLKLLNLQDH